MSTTKKRLRAWFERATGHEIVRLGRRSFGLISHGDRGDAWFSYRSQLRHLLDRERINLVIDVGANEGQFASGLRGDYSGDIVSFEPVASVFGRLKTRAAGDDRWHVMNLALGSGAGTHVMHVSNETKFSSFHSATRLSAERFGSAPDIAPEEVVSVRRLQDVLGELPPLTGRRIFLKMDTQGHDLEVFKGAGPWIEQVSVLQSELSVLPLYDGIEHWTDCLATYEQAGVGVAGMFPICRDADGRIIEYDCLMVRTGALTGA